MTSNVIGSEETASIIGVKVGTLHLYRREGRISLEPVAQVGNALLFDRAEVEALAASRRGARQ